MMKSHNTSILFIFFLRCTLACTHLSSAWSNQFPNRIMPLPEARVLRKIAWWLLRGKVGKAGNGRGVSEVGGAPSPPPSPSPPSTSFTAFGILCASTSASRQVHCVPNSLRVSGDKSSRWFGVGWLPGWVRKFVAVVHLRCCGIVAPPVADASQSQSPLLYGILLPVSSHLGIVHTAISPQHANASPKYSIPQIEDSLWTDFVVPTKSQANSTLLRSS